MNYLLDKKNKKQKVNRISIIVLLIVFLFYFRVGILSNLSKAAHFVFRPVLVLGNNIGNSFSDIGLIFHNRKALTEENNNLKIKLTEQDLIMANYNTILDENLKLKEIMDRKKNDISMILATILAKPNHSLYDTLIIDVGLDDGVQIGQKVFVRGNIPIGKIAEVEKNSSKVVLYTNPGEKTQAVISGKNIYIDLVGRGGGNFEIILPKDLVLEKWTEIILPDINPYLIGEVETIISDPRDSTQKALVVSPVNIQELKFVEVQK